MVFEDPYDDCRTDVPTTANISKVWTIMERDSRRITSEYYAQSTALHPDTSTFSLLNRPVSIKSFFNRPGIWVYYQLQALIITATRHTFRCFPIIDTQDRLSCPLGP